MSRCQRWTGCRWVGRIACGTPITAEENVEQMVCVPSRWHSTFTLTCKGDSMEPRIHDGDLVAIRSQPEVEQGEIAAVRIGDEATLKHVYLHENFIELRPENPAFESIILNQRGNEHRCDRRQSCGALPRYMR